MKKDLLTNPVLFWDTGTEFIEVYLPKIRYCTDDTIEAYRDSMNIYIKFLYEAKHISSDKVCFNNFSKEYLAAFQKWLLEDMKNSPRTSNLRISAITSFLNFARTNHSLLTTLYVNAKAMQRSISPPNPIEYFIREQMSAILSAPDTTRKIGRRDKVMLLVLYETGARVSEICSILLEDVHLKNKNPYIVLKGKGRKVRSVPILDTVKMELQNYIDEFHEKNVADAPLFYTRIDNKMHQLSVDTVRRVFKESVKSASNKGVNMPDNAHPHMVRKTRAMDLYQEGMALAHIQQILGHKSASTTTGFYAFATLDTLAKSLSELTEQNSDLSQKSWKDPEKMKKLQRFRF